VAWLCAELREAEVAAQIGAGLGERNPDRITNRNGYRTRGFDTRVGQIELAGGAESAMSADGSTLVFGAPGVNDFRGLVVFYTRQNGKWVERQTTQDPYGTPDNEFGGQVALSADGDVAELPTLNVTAGRTNNILMYVRSGSTC
jgi:hypothetical protein